MLSNIQRSMQALSGLAALLRVRNTTEDSHSGRAGSANHLRFNHKL